jgi:hypothetical protein
MNTSSNDTTNNPPDPDVGFFTQAGAPIPIPQELILTYDIAAIAAIGGDLITINGTTYRIANKNYSSGATPPYRVYLSVAERSEINSDTPFPTAAPHKNSAEAAARGFYYFRSNDLNFPAYLHRGEEALFPGMQTPLTVLEKHYIIFTNTYFDILFQLEL